MQLQFKFVENVTDEDRAGVLERLSSEGAERIRPLFPDEEDSELSSMFVVDVPGGGNGRKVLRELAASRVVQYAEEAPVRKLIR
jgi:hypothetical protein